MSEHPTPTSNVSPFPGQDQDVAEVEELLERLLATSAEADVTWSIVRERIGFDQEIAPLRPRRRPRRVLALAIAAALMMSGVALAALANQGQPSGHPRTPIGRGAQGLHDPAVHPGSEDEHPTPTLAPIDIDASPIPPDVSGQSPSAEAGQGSDQQQGQDQQGGQDQQASDQSTAPDQQQGQTDPTDVQSSASASTDGNQDPSPSAQATDQQS